MRTELSKAMVMDFCFTIGRSAAATARDDLCAMDGETMDPKRKRHYLQANRAFQTLIGIV